jgi:hypothetical protein
MCGLQWRFQFYERDKRGLSHSRRSKQGSRPYLSNLSNALSRADQHFPLHLALFANPGVGGAETRLETDIQMVRYNIGVCASASILLCFCGFSGD